MRTDMPDAYDTALLTVGDRRRLFDRVASFRDANLESRMVEVVAPAPVNEGGYRFVDLAVEPNEARTTGPDSQPVEADAVGPRGHQGFKALCRPRAQREPSAYRPCR